MINAGQLAEAFASNLDILKMQTKGLTHQDSLLQPPVRGNCLNWVLGHITVNRDRVLSILGEAPILSPGVTARYQTDSEPVTCEQEGILSLAELIDALERGQGLLSAALQRASEAELAREVQVGETSLSIRQRLFGLYFHETYHTGQTELLRQLAGTNDKII